MAKALALVSTWLAVGCGGESTRTAAPAGLGSTNGSGSAAAPVKPSAFPPSPSGFATADFVITSDGELATYEIVEGKPRKTSAITLVARGDSEQTPFDGLGEGDFADRDNLFLKIGERRVVRITASAITEITVPPASTFTVPRPASEDPELTEGGVVLYGLVVAPGAAYWSECPWGLPYDGFQCAVHVNAKLWPSTARVVEDGGVTAVEFGWQDHVPTGFKAAITSPGFSTLTCTTPARRRTSISVDPDASTEEIHSHQWVSATPPRLLVVFGSPGLADTIPERWTLHDGCTVSPVASGGTIEVGPAGLWLSNDEGEPAPRRILRRGADVLGELPAGNVRFRPLAPPKK